MKHKKTAQKRSLFTVIPLLIIFSCSRFYFLQSSFLFYRMERNKTFLFLRSTMSLAEEFDRYTNPSKETIQEIMKPVKAILFDMDGPLCRLFGSYPAFEVTHELKLDLWKKGHLPEEALLEDDFFEVLRSVNKPDKP